MELWKKNSVWGERGTGREKRRAGKEDESESGVA
jgi:hypothetical protein